MRSKTLQKLINETPEEVKIFTDLYADLVVRINRLIREKYSSQKEFAEKMGKKPSEISRWLSGDHNFTLKSIAKLSAELGEPLIHVPVEQSFKFSTGKVHFSKTVYSYKTELHAEYAFVQNVKKKESVSEEFQMTA